MKRPIIYSLLVVIAASLFSCSSDTNLDEKKSLIASIDSLQVKMFNPESMELDRSVASKGLMLYQEYVNKYPDDSLSAEYLFRSSDLARGLGDSKNSISYLENICKKYPKYKRIPECLFLQGYYHQEFFKDSVQAKYFYTQLIEKFPAHPFSKDAKVLLQLFGKSDADVIKDFEKKESQKN